MAKLPEKQLSTLATFKNTVVYRPGGVASGNVYTSFATAVDALNVIDTRTSRTLVVDARLAEAEVPAGTYDLRNMTISGIYGNDHFDAPTNPFTRLLIHEGAVFQNVWHFTNGIMLVFDGATPPIEITTPLPPILLEKG